MMLAASASHAQPNFVVRPPGTADFDVRFGAAHSDNLLRLPVDPESGRYRFLGTSFDYVRDGARFDANLAGDVERRKYSDATIASEPVGRINVFLDTELLPGRVSWVVNDNYGTGRTNAFIPSGPQNRQEINVFSTGPRIDVPVGARSSIGIEATRAESNFSESSRIDSDRETYDLTLNRSLSTTSQVGIGGSRRDVEFEGATDRNETKSFFILYDRQLASGSTAVRVGRSETEIGSTTWSTPLVDLSWARNLGTRTRLGVTATKGFADAATSFARDNTAGGNAAEFVVAVRDPYEFSQLGINLALTYERTAVTLSLAKGESQYTQTVDFDNDERSLRMAVQREVSARVLVGAAAGLREREFTRLAREDTDRFREVFLDKTFGPRWSMRLTLERLARDRGQGPGTYEEDVARLAVNIDLNP